MKRAKSAKLITWEASPAKGAQKFSGHDKDGRRWTVRLDNDGRWLAYGRHGVLEDRRGRVRHWAIPYGAMRACIADARVAPREEALERLRDPAPPSWTAMSAALSGGMMYPRSRLSRNHRANASVKPT